MHARAGRAIALSAKEFALLETFMRRPGEVLSRLHLLEHAWDFAYENRSNVVDVYVRRLRRKIDEPFGRDSLETVRGAGYRLRADGRSVSRLPIRAAGHGGVRASRWRSCSPASGLFLYLRLASHLAASLDRDLRLRAQDLAALVSQPTGLARARDRAAASSSAARATPSCWRRTGASLDATRPLGGRRCSRPAELRARRAARSTVDSDTGAGPGRAVARSWPRRSTRDGRPVVLVVGATLQNRAETLGQLPRRAR